MKKVMSFMTFKDDYFSRHDYVLLSLEWRHAFQNEFKYNWHFLFRFVLLFKTFLVPLKGRTISFACSENSSSVHAQRELLMMKKLHMMHRICLSTLHSRGKRDFFCKDTQLTRQQTLQTDLHHLNNFYDQTTLNKTNNSS